MHRKRTISSFPYAGITRIRFLGSVYRYTFSAGHYPAPLEYSIGSGFIIRKDIFFVHKRDVMERLGALFS